MNWDDKPYTERQKVLMQALNVGEEVSLDTLVEMMNISIEKPMSREGVVSCIRSLSNRLVQRTNMPMRIVRTNEKTGRSHRSKYKLEEI